MIEIPERFTAYRLRFEKEAGARWLAELPAMIASYVDRWGLTLEDAPPMHGMAALVLAVRQADGTPANLKLQQADGESDGEGPGLEAWAGDGAVRLLREDGVILLLERLRSRDLHSVSDPLKATQIIAELLARLNAHQAPAGIRTLDGIVSAMLEQVPQAAATLGGEEGELLKRWAAIVREVAGDAGDRLLHWDLHFENVLAAEREPWLAIDPKPIAGNPGFELLPAIDNRWDETAVLTRFDLMTEVMGLDRQEASAWTIARVLQNSLWSVEDGEPGLDPIQIAIAAALTGRQG